MPSVREFIFDGSKLALFANTPSKPLPANQGTSLAVHQAPPLANQGTSKFHRLLRIRHRHPQIRVNFNPPSPVHPFLISSIPMICCQSNLFRSILVQTFNLDLRLKNRFRLPRRSLSIMVSRFLLPLRLRDRNVRLLMSSFLKSRTSRWVLIALIFI
jgi:hypothetical protein